MPEKENAVEERIKAVENRLLELEDKQAQGGKDYSADIIQLKEMLANMTALNTYRKQEPAPAPTPNVPAPAAPAPEPTRPLNFLFGR